MNKSRLSCRSCRGLLIQVFLRQSFDNAVVLLLTCIVGIRVQATHYRKAFSQSEVKAILHQPSGGEVRPRDGRTCPRRSFLQV